MKRGTTPVIPVSIDMDIELVSEVTFIFKKEYKEESPALLKKVFPNDVAYYDGMFQIPLTEDETRLFKNDFYMDTRIVTISGTIPETSVCHLYMNSTLFSKEDTT